MVSRPLPMPFSQSLDGEPTDPQVAAFRRQAFLAALTGLMASPKKWDLDEDPATRFVELAWRTADLALLKLELPD